MKRKTTKSINPSDNNKKPDFLAVGLGDSAGGMEAIVRRLAEDLRRTRERLRTTIEQHETSIEELKASNEELQAVNEEMRSAGEELETGKEELQSVNEELTTVNQELKEKVDETNRINSDLQNLMSSTDIGTLFLDREMRVKRYTHPIEKLFNIIPGDIGRPLEHVTNNLDYPDLTMDADQVLRTLKISEREVADTDKNCYLARILPYRTTEDKIEGVVITFVDITRRLEAERRLRWLATVVESSNDAIFSFAFDQKIISWNAGAEEMFGYLAEEAIGLPLGMLTQPGREEEQAKLLNRTWHGETIEDFETVQIHKGGAEIDISLNLAPIRDEGKNIVGMSATIQDITKRKQADERLREAEERQRLLIESAEDFAIFTMTTDGIVNSWNTGAERVFGFTEEEILGRSADILFTPEDREHGVPQKEQQTAIEEGRAEDERYHLRKDGSRFYASGVMTPLREGGMHGFAKIARDLTDRKLAEEALRQAQEELEAKVVERTAELAETNESLRREIIERERAEEERVGLLQKIVTTQEDERSRIARDLHDTLGQRLTALRLKIASLRETCGDDEELCARVNRLGEIGAMLDEEVSFLAWELRPAALDDLGLAAAAGNYVNEWSRHFEIPADFHSTGLKNKRLDPDIETHLYRIVQEALNNVYKHAKASQASVILERRQKLVVLIVEDDGKGFDPKAKVKVKESGRGLGLIGMRERAALVGGSVEIESKSGSGTTVFVKVPCIPGENKEG